MSDNELVIPQHDHITADLPIDEYHPSNQQYMSDLAQIRRAIVSVTVNMTPWHVEAVKSRLVGNTNEEIAIQHKVTPQSVSRALSGDKAKELKALLQHYQVSIDGPAEAQRRRMLWEIAVDNQDVEPRVAIASLTELNKMAGTYNAGDNAGKEIKITINNQILPKGELDK